MGCGWKPPLPGADYNGVDRRLGNLRHGVSPDSIRMASHGKEKKSALQHGDTHDKLNMLDYAQAIASLKSFRQQHRYGLYIFKVQNHRIVSAEGQPKIFGQL